MRLAVGSLNDNERRPDGRPPQSGTAPQAAAGVPAPMRASEAWQLAIETSAEIADRMARLHPNAEAAEAARMIERAIRGLRLGKG